MWPLFAQRSAASDLHSLSMSHLWSGSTLFADVAFMGRLKGPYLGNMPDFVIRFLYMDRVKQIWYLSPMRAAKVQASLRIRAVSPEPSLLAHTSSESRRTFRQKARSLAPLNGWACAVKICHDGMLEDTNSLDGAHIQKWGQHGQSLHALHYSCCLTVDNCPVEKFSWSSGASFTKQLSKNLQA